MMINSLSKKLLSMALPLARASARLRPPRLCLPSVRPFSLSTPAPTPTPTPTPTPPPSAHATRPGTGALLYVPASSEKMLRKAAHLRADTVILDLEDSVARHRKDAAREGAAGVIRGGAFRREGGAEGTASAAASGSESATATATATATAAAAPPQPPPPTCAVRINAPSEDLPAAQADLAALLPLVDLSCLVVPKVEHESDALRIADMAQRLRAPVPAQPLSLVLSIESPAALLRADKILDALQRNLSDGDAPQPHVCVAALLFAAEDFCHAGNIVRSRSRRELLLPRQMVSLTAKAYGLAAVDMVCVDYSDEAYLAEECADGREIGFDGKQAIHPVQVETIQRCFAPSEEDVFLAAKIRHAYEQAVRGNRGAVGIQVQGGKTLMIDAPMLKQAEAVLAKAIAAGQRIPTEDETWTGTAKSRL